MPCQNASDVIVIGAPFYTFSIPTQLKAWIDRLAQAGLTDAPSAYVAILDGHTRGKSALTFA